MFFEYNDLIELKEHVNRHLSLEFIGGAKDGFAADKIASPHQKNPSKTVVSEEIYFEDYEKDGVARSFLVKGSTQKIKSELKQLGGKWNKTLGGWIFSKKREDEIQKALREFL